MAPTWVGTATGNSLPARSPTWMVRVTRRLLPTAATLANGPKTWTSAVRQYGPTSYRAGALGEQELRVRVEYLRVGVLDHSLRRQRMCRSRRGRSLAARSADPDRARSRGYANEQPEQPVPARLPLARLGPSTSCSTQNQRSADGHSSPSGSGGQGRTRWATRSKPALNAFTMRARSSRRPWTIFEIVARPILGGGRVRPGDINRWNGSDRGRHCASARTTDLISRRRATVVHDGNAPRGRPV